MILDVRPQGWVLVPRALLAVLVLAGAVAAQVVGVSAVAAWLLVGLLAATLGWLLLGYLRWVTTSFVLTTDRLVHRSGILGRNSREIPLDKLSDISYRQSLLERVVAIGDLVLESAGRDSAEIFEGLPRPARIQREIHRQLELGRMQASGAVAGTPGYPVPSIPQQIEQLAELARRGVLTEAEFQAKKAELLNRL